jgi:UDPglucose--hexose-1-phosphate uridylyltransferase
VPYETWILDRKHNSLFEEPLRTANRRDLAALLGRMLRRLRHVAPAYHLVVHTSPNTMQKRDMPNFWQTIAEDYHWHIEILPIVPGGSKSYSLKEAYFNALSPETAAEELRQLDPSHDSQ